MPSLARSGCRWRRFSTFGRFRPATCGIVCVSRRKWLQEVVRPASNAIARSSVRANSTILLDTFRAACFLSQAQREGHSCSCLRWAGILVGDEAFIERGSPMAAVERGSGQEVLEMWMKAQLDEHLTEPNSRLGASHSVHAPPLQCVDAASASVGRSTGSTGSLSALSKGERNRTAFIPPERWR